MTLNISYQHKGNLQTKKFLKLGKKTNIEK